MRWWIAALLLGCGSSHGPEWTESDFAYAFAVETEPWPFDPTATPHYEYRLDGTCMGRRADGEPFTPHVDRSRPPRPGRFVPAYPDDAGSVPIIKHEWQPGAVWLAPRPVVVVEVTVGSGVRGCQRAELDSTHTTVVRIAFSQTP